LGKEAEMDPIESIRRIGLVSRLSLGTVWLYQGIVPKWLQPLLFEQEVVRATGLYLGSPALMIELVGMAETLLGLWILSGWRIRQSCLCASLFMLTMQVLVVWSRPDLMIGPFGCLIKNLSLFAAAWVVIECEKAARGGGRKTHLVTGCHSSLEEITGEGEEDAAQA